VKVDENAHTLSLLLSLSLYMICLKLQKQNDYPNDMSVTNHQNVFATNLFWKISSSSYKVWVILLEE